MAIQPIDLQTMYTSLEKVSKLTQSQQGMQLQGAIQQEENSKRLQEQAKAVEKTTADDEGPLQIKDRNSSDAETQDSETERKSQEELGEKLLDSKQIITDPNLGQHIDITG